MRIGKLSDVENPSELVDYYEGGKFVGVMTKLEALMRWGIAFTTGIPNSYYTPAKVGHD